MSEALLLLTPLKGRDEFMPQPRLLLIDDEPALAEFLANAARSCGFDPIVTARDEEFRDAFIASRPEWSRSISACPGWTGSS